MTIYQTNVNDFMVTVETKVRLKKICLMQTE